MMGCHADSKKFELFKKYLLGLRRVTYPDVLEFQGVVIIGLNSMKSETGFWDGLLADGEIGSKQLNELGSIIDIVQINRRKKNVQKIVVCLHHHPFLFPDDQWYEKIGEWMGHYLKDGDDLMKILYGKIDVLLFGHEHRHTGFTTEFGVNNNLSEYYQIPNIYSNGSSTEDSRHLARLVSFQPNITISTPWS